MTFRCISLVFEEHYWKEEGHIVIKYTNLVRLNMHDIWVKKVKKVFSWILKLISLLVKVKDPSLNFRLEENHF